MKKLYLENGMLSEFGKDAFSKFLDHELEVLLSSAKTENEAMIVGSLIQKRVGDMVCDYIQKLKE
jgi:hypothetical protein